MNQILKDENYISIYEILKSLLEITKEKCIYIISSKECPKDLWSLLDSVLYAVSHLEINELILFKDKMKKLYGEQYVIKAENNTDKLINEKLVELLMPNNFSEEIINSRIKLLIQQKQNNEEKT